MTLCFGVQPMFSRRNSRTLHAVTSDRLSLISRPVIKVWAADETDTSIETILVTANRTADSGATLGQAWSALSTEDVAAVDLQHSNQLFNRVSGAWVSRGNGQESLISLRSPVLTGRSLWAFFTAEDGINLRAPGFCNVNQLFDANLLQAAGVEVVKGPANATYGPMQ